MTFEEGNFYTLNGVVDIARCQSKRIKELEERLIESRTRVDDLERWIAGIADDHKQIPDWIQQSARSLLAQEGE